MSREKRNKPRKPKSTVWAALDGVVLNGGCSQCHAEIHLHVDTNDYSAKRAQVHHDDDCPEMALRQRTGATQTMLLTPPKGMSMDEFVDLAVETCGPEVLALLKSYKPEELPPHLREIAALAVQMDGES